MTEDIPRRRIRSWIRWRQLLGPVRRVMVSGPSGPWIFGSTLSRRVAGADAHFAREQGRERALGGNGGAQGWIDEWVAECQFEFNVGGQGR